MTATNTESLDHGAVAGDEAKNVARVTTGPDDHTRFADVISEPIELPCSALNDSDAKTLVGMGRQVLEEPRGTRVSGGIGEVPSARSRGPGHKRTNLCSGGGPSWSGSG